ncbi:lysozyme-like [Schistocerca piceifrons]|uniref:lysozyme-like n=1 Tax=Schistocerca piceifrons TaxID=274613 RepID=UPI001F5EE4E2|nr:lysozyme-like [Schistocerca piceifrons]
MARYNTTLLTTATVLCVVSCWALVAGQLPATGNPQAPVSDLCLGCICEAVSGCNRTLGCNGDVCGLFRITWAYWADAGKPVIAQDDPNSDGAYVRCVTEPFCAARVVQGYMSKFGQDCNGDQRIDCFDFAAIHRLGGYGCTGALDYNYQSRFMLCQQQVAQLVGNGQG